LCHVNWHEIRESNSYFAQGGIAAVTGEDATFSVNFSETWSILPEYPALTTGRAERLLRLKSTENQFRAYLDKKTNSYKYPQSLAEQYENTRGMYHGFWFPDKNSMPDVI
jgi:TonB-dependent starch-binding outer membrane protein SusC